MGKKDYVLEKALQGDMDALENILGGLLSPLFDLAFHFYDDSGRAAKEVEGVLRVTAHHIVDNDLGGEKPIQTASRLLCAALADAGEERGRWHDFLAGLDCGEGLPFLVHFSLDLHDAALDEALSLRAGQGMEIVRDCLEQSETSREQWREIFDEHASMASLPTGCVDSIVTDIEDQIS